MALDLSSFGVMEHLWETLDKTPDGKHIRYLRGACQIPGIQRVKMQAERGQMVGNR